MVKKRTRIPVYEISTKNLKTGKVSTIISIFGDPKFKKGKKFTIGMGRFKSEHKYIKQVPVKKNFIKKLVKSWS